MIQIQARRARFRNLREEFLHGWRCQVCIIEESEHAGCGWEVVCIVDGDAEVVCFCSVFGLRDVFCEEVVGGLPLWWGMLVGRRVGVMVRRCIYRARSCSLRRGRGLPSCSAMIGMYGMLVNCWQVDLMMIFISSHSVNLTHRIP